MKSSGPAIFFVESSLIVNSNFISYVSILFFFYISIKQFLVLLIFFCWFLAFNFIDFCCDFYNFYWLIFFFLLHVFRAIHFLLNIVFILSCKLWKFVFHFHLVQNYLTDLEISLTHVLFRSKLFNLKIFWNFQYSWASLVAQLAKNPAMRETWVWSLGWEDPLGKGKATHSSVLAWKIPWTA